MRADGCIISSCWIASLLLVMLCSLFWDNDGLCRMVSAVCVRMASVWSFLRPACLCVAPETFRLSASAHARYKHCHPVVYVSHVAVLLFIAKAPCNVTSTVLGQCIS